VEFDKKGIPFYNSPIPVPSPNWGRVQKFRGSWFKAKENASLSLKQQKALNFEQFLKYSCHERWSPLSNLERGRG